MRRGLMLALLLCLCTACAATEPISTPAAPAAGPAGPAGAKAAPEAGASPSVDPRRAQFEDWFSYQSVDGDDPGKSLDQAWADGVVACARRAANGTINQARALVQQLGWSLNGATAVVAAAVRAMCPAWDSVPPYRTAFDFNVARARYDVTAVWPMTTPGPLERQVGWFAKLACAHLSRNGLNGLEPVLHSHRVGAWNTHARAASFIQAFGEQDERLRRATGLVVHNVCDQHYATLRSSWGLP